MGVGVDEVWVRWVPMLSLTKYCVFACLCFSMAGIYDLYGCSRCWSLIPSCVYMCGPFLCFSVCEVGGAMVLGDLCFVELCSV